MRIERIEPRSAKASTIERDPPFTTVRIAQVDDDTASRATRVATACGCSTCQLGVSRVITERIRTPERHPNARR